MSDVIPKIGIRIKNDSGMTIPAYSIVVVTSVEETKGDANTDPEVIHHAKQYGCGTNGNVYVTGGTTILPTGYGTAYADPIIYALIDYNIAPPISGEEWGPTDNQWFITRGGKGFFAQGYPTGATPNQYSSSMFLRTFNRAPASICSSGSSSRSSSSSNSSGSSGSNSSSSSSNCVTVVTNVTCSGGNLVVTYGQAAKCGLGYVLQGQQYRNINTGDYIDVVQ